MIPGKRGWLQHRKGREAGYSTGRDEKAGYSTGREERLVTAQEGMRRVGST